MKFTLNLDWNTFQIHYEITCEKFKNIQWMNSRAPPNQAYVPTKVEHVANLLTHAACIAPATVGAKILLQRSSSPSQAIAAIVYGLALCLLFMVSTSFHSFCYRQKDCQMKHFLHRCDRAMIYIFIAGSYFPWLTVSTLSCQMLADLRWLIWLLAGIGITYQQLFHERYKMLELLFYLIMGLGPAIIVLFSQQEIPAMSELKFGGLLYLVGVLFFKMDGRLPFAHAIWHVFVALAASVHYMAILKNLFPV